MAAAASTATTLNDVATGGQWDFLLALAASVAFLHTRGARYASQILLCGAQKPATQSEFAAHAALSAEPRGAIGPRGLLRVC